MVRYDVYVNMVALADFLSSNSLCITVVLRAFI
jgi:hypothetical protein